MKDEASKAADEVPRAVRIGLTGGIGSGKTTVARAFAALMVPIYYTDARARELMESNPLIRRDLVELFGEQAYTDEMPDKASGEVEGDNWVLNRPFIASQVFADHSLLARLDGIVHPRVADDFAQWASAQTAPYVIIESAILYESGFERVVDVVVTVSAPEAQRVARAAARDGVSAEKIRQRMAAQMTDAERESRAHITIHNADDDPILPSILALHEKFSK